MDRLFRLLELYIYERGGKEKVQELTEDKDNSELNWRTIAERYEDEHYLSIEEEENE